MGGPDVPHFLGLLVVMLAAAKVFGAAAQWIGQPAVLGELVACVADLGEDGYERFLRQDLPATIQLRTTCRSHTAHPAYEWIDRVQCVGIGVVEMSTPIHSTGPPSVQPGSSQSRAVYALPHPASMIRRREAK